MPLDFYCLRGSPPCAAVKVAAKLVGVDLNPIEVDLWKGEHIKPQFLAINPVHTVPVIRDGNLTLIESRAILTYLFEQYGKNHSYYPKDPKERALVDQRLYFDMGVLYSRMADYYFVSEFTGAPKDPEKLVKLTEALNILETFLTDTEYTAGKVPTVADITLAITISTYEALKHDLSLHPKILEWYEKCQRNIPGFADIAAQSQKEFEDTINELKKKL